VRITMSLAAAFTLFALTLPARSQDNPRPTSLTGLGFAQTLNGVNPRNIVNVPVDTTKAMATLNINSAFKTPSQPKPFSLGNMFPKFSLPSFPPKQASTPIITPQNNPFQTITPAQQ
jgi:hypothetical protein